MQKNQLIAEIEALTGQLTNYIEEKNEFGAARVYGRIK